MPWRCSAIQSVIDAAAQPVAVFCVITASIRPDRRLLDKVIAFSWVKVLGDPQLAGKLPVTALLVKFLHMGSDSA